MAVHRHPSPACLFAHGRALDSSYPLGTGSVPPARNPLLAPRSTSGSRVPSWMVPPCAAA